MVTITEIESEDECEEPMLAEPSQSPTSTPTPVDPPSAGPAGAARKHSELWDPWGWAVLIMAVLLAMLVVKLSSPSVLKPRLWSAEALAKHNGSDPKLPILLGILGSVFDVSKGRNHYGPEGAYSHFSGRDASRAFVSGNFTGDGLTDSLDGLSSLQVLVSESCECLSKYGHLYLQTKHRMYARVLCDFIVLNGAPVKTQLEYRSSKLNGRQWMIQNVQVKSIMDWHKFFQNSTKYIYVGKLVGRFYNESGLPTKEFVRASRLAARGERVMKEQKEDEGRFPSCNSRWNAEQGGEVWCTTGYPRIVEKISDGLYRGTVDTRCACFELEAMKGRKGLREYEGCPSLSQKCQSAPPQA